MSKARPQPSAPVSFRMYVVIAVRKDPVTWDTVFSGGLTDRGYTMHSLFRPFGKHLDQFGLINMNGRVYDPQLGRFLSPDPFITSPNNPQNYNRYAYALNNPLKYTDPDGEWIHLAIGAAIGGTINWLANGAEFNLEGLGYFGIGAAAGALGAGIGTGMMAASAGSTFSAGFIGTQSAMTTISTSYTSSFLSGAAIGGASGFGSGFTTGFGNGLMQEQSLGDALGTGLESGAIAGASGALLGGIAGGIHAVSDGRNFLDGSYTYKSPVNNNFGTQNGECVLRCFEEFSDSYGMDQYDYNYWFNENGNELGVKPNELEKLVDGTNVFSSDPIKPNANSIADAISNNQRVLMGFNTKSGGGHAVMVNQVKIWPSGRYRLFFSETSPQRIAPYSTSNIFELGGVGFWYFFPN